jgi:hypothetical protein
MFPHLAAAALMVNAEASAPPIHSSTRWVGAQEDNVVASACVSKTPYLLNIAHEHVGNS